MTTADGPTLHPDRTEQLCVHCGETLDAHDDPFEAARSIVPRLGAHWRDGVAEFGFWTPDLESVPADDVVLELFTPPTDADPGAAEQTVSVEYDRVPTHRSGEYTWAAVSNVRPGRRDQLGTLYRLTYRHDGEWETVSDPLAYSMPFGAYAPAELYDVDHLDSTRPDREYFETLGTDDERIETAVDDGLPRVEPATNMIEIHPRSATADRSLAGLTRLYEAIGRKQRAGEPLTPTEQTFAGYDGVQLLPLAPIAEGAYQPDHFELLADPNGAASTTIDVTLRSPDMCNWGYDIVISGFGAINPAVLETGRPDELVDFIAAVHDLPEPMRVVFDIALGHADDGALSLLPPEFIQGPGMYGQELDYTQPTVRAILLELQRRKMDWGADGIRVDGAQDFTNWDPETESEWHDDEFLAEMDAITQTVAGTEYRPWMIFEDGRPWPEEDWELASTYRELIDQHPHAFQWGPVTFAHNTPAILTFWATKWWRVREVAEMGSQWISGVANHDTLRRGAQVEIGEEWNATQENPYLGDRMHETIGRAYNNPASNALFYCFLPGVPMDFVNANVRAPWDFIRDTDDRWNVKVVGEAAYFVDWHVTEERYSDGDQFRRLHNLGFEDREELREFVHALAAAVDVTEYDLESMATILSVLSPPIGDGEVTAADLEEFALAWMRDLADYCNLANRTDDLDPDRTAFDRRLRAFRHDRPWLRSDLTESDVFDYQHPTGGTVLYYGLRRAPDGSEDVLFVANMEGSPKTVVPADLVETTRGGWEVALSTPDLADARPDASVTLADSDVVVFSRTR